MLQYIESFKIENGIFLNSAYHNRRFNDSLRRISAAKTEIDLHDHIAIPEGCFSGLFKGRVIYNSQGIVKIEFVPYCKRSVTTLKIIHDDEIDYSLKYEDRNRLNILFSKRENCDDIIIIKKGFVTDASSSNLVFFEGIKYFTPSTPLLRGTKREKLIDERIIFEKEIKQDSINQYEKCYLINAMIDLGEIEIDVHNIY